MSKLIPLRRPGAEVADRHELEESFEVAPFDLYGRHHEIKNAEASIGVTRLSEGLHLDLDVRVTIETTCDRTLEPVELELTFGDSEFLLGPDNKELCIEDWELNLTGYTEHALPSETPIQVFKLGTEPVRSGPDEQEKDPRWQGLDDLFASGF